MTYNHVMLLRNIQTLSVLILLVLATACTGNSERFETMHGSITNVEPKNQYEIQSLTVLDDKGKTWVFGSEGPIELNTPEHLKIHMVDNLEIRVVFERKETNLILINIYDYP